MQAEQPWVLLKGSDDDKERGSTVIGLCCQMVALLCALLQPYMPHTTRRLREQLSVEQSALRLNSQKPAWIQYLPAGHKIGKPEPLFAKIDPAVVEQLKAKYAGTQSERAQQNGDAKGAGGGSVADLEAAIAAQGEKVRQLKASTKDKSVWQPEVNKLLELKKQLQTAQAQTAQAQTAQAKPSEASGDVASLEKAIAEQGEKVRQLKASTKDKSVWQPEVNKLLELKKQLQTAQAKTAQAQTAQAQTAQAKPSQASGDVASLEKAIAEQGEKVRQLKSSTKDKSVWQPEVNKLLELKKQLQTAQTQTAQAQTAQAKPSQTSGDVASLEKAIAEQGDKVRKLKASTKDKTVWQPEVNKLLELKKQLADAQK
ncbi:WHEP-TRS domain-containing protein [Phthorimaea operculella]|nr:WHEP-TRS domain-containing protein [Phthorimaea operculella]